MSKPPVHISKIIAEIMRELKQKKEVQDAKRDRITRGSKTEPCGNR